ncbi:50S ribosomal protein L17 [Candidatus Nomurabacteria bacterium RIFCSPLOWO2_02_40_28]|uniref:Large ribosomal subunit protein bL17 n=2 Tax=Candidatus Nomuraibacteriota TaxID=1752729 RepID=A0A837HV35_9BACT|nr:MAG: 50S ribosomal protein L17 [Candidatus Nomurabacteria bacterium GW2011_GWD2_39_12]KKR20880.1 MAG: 50S ribosomal protein L17 [Candidatus Nomurabacteria bacterium GW2011_GWC2_39_41]KKR36404.1 MAG: 50S ribosomal protein L17 [Candidatus Nomurabacteria bacterium GW2011_GWE2_40_10]KKR38829.1 MAG: 50S ribosomal protein L17 [Candidatus Nomurabacteria bacterium GW2011_GWB1_40_11]KKR40027.1 MAG: 50S ribosomal protein L17 [Parcubacteria group bacterium GW2011_GWC1_40_11]KKR59216.1 MAG: 50S ribosom
MRHHNSKRKFGREKTQRNALVNSLAFNLIVRGKIKTTLPKAKELRPFVEKLVTRAKRGDLATRRSIISKLGGHHSREVKKLFEVIAPKYKDTKGGYTRVLKLGTRKADGAPMAIIEFV